MTILGIIVGIFGVFALSRVILRYHSREISHLEAVFWLVLWSVVLMVVFFPEITTQFSQLIGIGRGVDSAFFVAILLLFYLVFRLYVKIDKLDKHITDLVIALAKKEKK